MTQALRRAFDYLRKVNADIPLDIYLKGLQVGVIKAAGDLAPINSTYHDAITQALVGYFENGGSVSSPKSAFKRAATEAMGGAVDLGWTDGGNAPPIDEDVLSWFNARLNQEYGYIDMLFEEAKQLRKESDFDYFTWATARADGYTNSLKEVYNYARLNSMRDIMVTFDGDDGAESCVDCQKYKGQRHRISWFISRNAVPPFGSGLECHRGGKCQHGLIDDKGKWVTV